MESLLKDLFDYQKFEHNEKLAEFINEIDNAGFSSELSDDDLFLVAAAGTLDTIAADEDIDNSLNEIK